MQKNLLIDAGKILLDIALEHVPVFAGKGRVTVNRGMGSFAFAAGVRIEDKAAVEQGLDHIAKGMMHHPVAVWCRADQPYLRIIDGKIVIVAMPVSLFHQLPLQAQKLFFKTEIK